MTRYEEIMDRVVVTDGMRERILRNIRQQQRHTHNMRSATRWLPILAAAAVMLVVCGVAYSNFGARNQTMTEMALDAPESKATSEPIGTTENDEEAAVAAAAEEAVDSDAAEGIQATAIYNAVDYDSAGALSEAVGFPVADITTLPFTATETHYTAIMGDLAEIAYYDADNNEVYYRKSPGTEDNSGDYNTYSVIVDAAIGEYPLTLSGDEQLFHLATWTDGSYAYSIGVTGGCTEEALRGMVEEVMQQ